MKDESHLEQSMQYQAIAVDYDGTLATNGHVDEATVFALKQYHEAGGRLLLVTGRKITDLRHVFPAFEIFDGIVGENGAVFYRPETNQVR